YEADFACPLGADRVAGQQELQRDADAAGVHQAGNPSVSMVKAALDFERSEAGAVRCNADIAGESKFQPAGDSPTVHCREDWLVDPVQPAGDPAKPVVELPARQTCVARQEGPDEVAE